MKRYLSVLLLVVLLCQALPLNALATVGRVLSEEELARAYALTGLGEGSGVYHNGMSPNAAWNAAQLTDWLEEKLELDMNNISDILSRANYALGQLAEDDPEAFRQWSEYSGTYERVQALTVEAEALREEMRYYKKRMEECSGVIAEMKAALEADDSMFDSDRVRMSARIEEAAADLVADRQYVTDHFDEWEGRMEELQDCLQ